MDPHGNIEIGCGNLDANGLGYANCQYCEVRIYQGSTLLSDGSFTVNGEGTWQAVLDRATEYPIGEADCKAFCSTDQGSTYYYFGSGSLIEFEDL